MNLLTHRTLPSLVQYGFDPQVHPLMLYPESVVGPTSISLSLTDTVTSAQDGKLRLSTPDRVPDVNRYVVSMYDASGAVIKEHVLDYNERIGFNPESTDTLDTPDTTKPYLEPDGFGYSTLEWDMDLIIPSDWIGTKEASDYFEVKVINTFGGGSVSHSWGSDQAW